MLVRSSKIAGDGMSWKIGDTVWYAPSGDVGPMFRAVVASVPWMCGSTEVVTLEDLPPAYSTYNEVKRNYVVAAVTNRIFPREPSDRCESLPGIHARSAAERNSQR